MAHLPEPQLGDPKRPKTVTASAWAWRCWPQSICFSISLTFTCPIPPRPHCVSVSPSFSLSPFLNLLAFVSHF